MRTEMLAEDGVVRFAYFASLCSPTNETRLEKRLKSTYNEFEVLGESKADYCEHAIKGIIILVNSA